MSFMLLFVHPGQPHMRHQALAVQARNGVAWCCRFSIQSLMTRRAGKPSRISSRYIASCFIDRRRRSMKMLSRYRPPVHRDAYARLGQFLDPGRSGELRSLIRIHDFRRSVSGDGFVQSIHTRVGMHRVAEPPAQDLASDPIRDREPGIGTRFGPARR